MRALFGAAFWISMVPGMSPPGVLSVIVPDMMRVLTFANAARPPIAAMLFSISSSAVCAAAGSATASTTMISAARIAIFMIDSPSSILRFMGPNGSKCKTQLASKPGVLAAAANVDASRRIEAIAMDEKHTQARQRFPAPALRRDRATRAERKLDRNSHSRFHGTEHRLDFGD